MSKLYLLHHYYDDGSAHGVVPVIMDEREKSLVEIVLEFVGSAQRVEFVEVQKLPPSILPTRGPVLGGGPVIAEP